MPVFNRHLDREYIGEDAISITRPGRWGNPFIIGRDGDRETVIERYRVWLWQRINSGEVSIEELADLDGRQLVCEPAACHGDVLEAAAKWATGRLRAEPSITPATE